MTSEHPFFVPHGDDRIAAVLALPDLEPRGLVLMARSHHERTWVRTARVLADRGIASVRMDYLGVGDSTGDFRSERDASAVPWAQAVLDVAARITGVTRFGALGVCREARVALALAEVPQITTVLLLVRGPGALRVRRVGQAREADLPRSTIDRWRRRFGRIVRRPPGGARSPRRSGTAPALIKAARTTDVLILHFGRPEGSSRFEQRFGKLRALARRSGRVFDVRHLPGIDRHGFGVPHEQRDQFAHTLAAWIDETIDRQLPGADALADVTGGPIEWPAATGGVG